MLHNTFCRRLAALVLTLAVALSAVLPVFAVYPMPVQTATETEAVYLFNADTGKTILSQNADQQKYVASLTKLMTALLLVESGKDLNGEVTVPTDLTQEFKDIQNANGTTMGLRIGETVRRIDLLNAMLIVSANDAASVIAWDVGGSVKATLCQPLGVQETVGHKCDFFQWNEINHLFCGRSGIQINKVAFFEQRCCIAGNGSFFCNIEICFLLHIVFHRKEAFIPGNCSAVDFCQQTLFGKL